MIFFWIMWGIDALVSLVLLYFFFAGLADHSVSSYNAGLWLGILAALAGIMLGSLWLKSHGRVAIGILLLCILAIPSLLYGLMLLIMVTSDANWH